jgi:hypothetical protein
LAQALSSVISLGFFYSREDRHLRSGGWIAPDKGPASADSLLPI